MTQGPAYLAVSRLCKKHGIPWEAEPNAAILLNRLLAKGVHQEEIHEYMLEAEEEFKK
jgi:hypothetical protein